MFTVVLHTDNILVFYLTVWIYFQFNLAGLAVSYNIYMLAFMLLKIFFMIVKLYVKSLFGYSKNK